MSDLIWLSEAQMRRIEPCFPLSHGVARVNERRVIRGIMFVIRNGLRWRDAPKEYGPHKTIYNRSSTGAGWGWPPRGTASQSDDRTTDPEGKMHHREVSQTGPFQPVGIESYAQNTGFGSGTPRRTHSSLLRLFSKHSATSSTLLTSIVRARRKG